MFHYLQQPLLNPIFFYLFLFFKYLVIRKYTKKCKKTYVGPKSLLYLKCRFMLSLLLLFSKEGRVG